MSNIQDDLEAFEALYLSLCERSLTIHEIARRCWKAGAALSQHAAEQAGGAQLDSDRRTQAIMDLVDAYGDARATAACHGEYHCRKTPTELWNQIELLLAAPKQAEQQAGPVPPFGHYYEPSDGSAGVFRKSGQAFPPTALGGMMWTLYTHPAPSQDRDKEDAELLSAAEQALACMTGLQQYLGYGGCGVEASQLKAAIDAARAAGKE